MTLHRAFCLLVTACLIAGPAARARGGVTDTPLPTFSNANQGAGAARLVAVLPTVVKNHNAQTDVVCTNVGSTPVDVGLEVFDQAGQRGNTIAAGNGAALNLPAGGTVTIGTGTTVALHEDVAIVLEAPVTRLAQGSARIVATSLQVACVAYAVDKLHAIKDPRHSTEQPPTIAVLPVRSACSPAACSDGNPCTIDGCDHAGVCTHTVAPNGTSCDDGNACTTADVCSAGVCLGSPVNCDDGNVCTTDACDPARGCTHTPADGTPCDDANACTTADVCAAGRCGGTPVSCDDGNACTTDTCDAVSGCQHTAVPGCSTTTTVSTTTTSTSTSSTTTSNTVPSTSTTSTSSSSTTSSSSSTSSTTSSTSTTSTSSSSTTSISPTSTSSTSSSTSTTSPTTSTSTTSSSTTSSTVAVPTTTTSTLASTTTTSTVATTTSTTSVTSTTAATTSSSTTTTSSSTTTTSSSSTTTSSSSTTTLSSTTTTLAPPPPTTTTTLPGTSCVIGTSTGCDDGDPCTADTCTAGGCRHEPMTGVDAVACVLDGGLQVPPACVGQQLPPAITAGYAQGRILVGKAAQSARVKQRRRLVAKAAKVLQSAARRVTGKHSHISVDCARSLEATLQEAATRAAQVAAAL